MKGPTMLLALFVVLTIAFASISAFEYLNYGTTTAITTTITTASAGQKQIPFKSSSNPLQKNGNITIGSTSLFTYTSLQSPGAAEPTPSTTLENVTFTYLRPNATITGALCYVFKVTFQDASSETLSACSFPTSFETVLALSSHNMPTAGLLLVPSVGVYALVSV